MPKKSLLPGKGRAGDWFRVGVFSATVIAPLLARWNDLRMAERGKGAGKRSGKPANETRDLRQMAVEQARELSELAAQRSQEWAELALARSNEWRDLAAGRANEWGGVAAERARVLGDQASALSEDLLALATERAGGLREQAVSRLEEARQQFLATKTYDALKEAVPVIAKLDNRRSRRNSATLWILGVGVGILAAGTIAFVIARARLGAGNDEQLVELPGAGRAANKSATNGTNGAKGVKGMSASGTNASGTNASGTNASGTNASRGSTDTSKSEGPAPTVAGALSGLRAAAERHGVQSVRDIDTTQTARVAPIVGNIHTKVYHDASDVSNLPTEENRVYFANEDEARAAGFHPSHPTAAEHNETQSSRP